MTIVLDGSNGITAPGGTAAAPSLTTSGDTNTGIFFPAADTIAFSEGGVEAARFNSSGQLDLVNNPILTGGTANGVLFLNASKVATSGTALVFDGTNLGLSCTPSSFANFTYLSINGTTGSILNLRSNNTTQFEINTTGTLNNFSSITTLPFVWSINSAERMRLDSSGNLGIGTSSPGSILEIKTTTPIITLSSTSYTNQYQTTLGTRSGAEAFLIFGNNGPNEIRAGRTNTGGYLDFYTNNTVAQTSASDGNFVMRLNASGNLLVGTTAIPNVGITGQFGFSVSSSEVVISKSGADGLIIRTTSAASNNIRFYNLNNQVGSVSTTTTATAYNTSSDYRLKNTIAPITGALAKVALLKPCTFKWDADGSDGQGFIAHELAEVVPDCVTGEKDAVDVEGNPRYQGVDTSFLVATLAAAIQELTARVAALEGNN